jgi:hypothetical protein
MKYRSELIYYKCNVMLFPSKKLDIETFGLLRLQGSGLIFSYRRDINRER